MIILEPKHASTTSVATPSNHQPPTYSNDIPMAGGSQPIFTPPLSPPPAMARSTDRYTSTPMTPREEALVGEEYRLQLLARCAQGNHQPRRHYGVPGIILAIILFPIGLICLAYVSDTMHHCSLLIWLEVLIQNKIALDAAYASIDLSGL